MEKYLKEELRIAKNEIHSLKRENFELLAKMRQSAKASRVYIELVVKQKKQLDALRATDMTAEEYARLYN